MHEERSCRAPTGLIDDKDDTNAWVAALTIEGGEDENDGTHMKMESTELQGWLEPNPKSTVPPGTTPKFIQLFAAHVVCSTGQLGVKEISTLVVDFLNHILQCGYEKWKTGVHSVVNSVVEQLLFDWLRREVMDDILEKHIANYFDSSDATNKSGGKLLCTNALKP